MYTYTWTHTHTHMYMHMHICINHHCRVKGIWIKSEAMLDKQCAVRSETMPHKRNTFQKLDNGVVCQRVSDCAALEHAVESTALDCGYLEADALLRPSKPKIWSSWCDGRKEPVRELHQFKRGLDDGGSNKSRLCICSRG